MDYVISLIMIFVGVCIWIDYYRRKRLIENIRQLLGDENGLIPQNRLE